jgi:hypothetical protein
MRGWACTGGSLASRARRPPWIDVKCCPPELRSRLTVRPPARGCSCGVEAGEELGEVLAVKSNGGAIFL